MVGFILIVVLVMIGLMVFLIISVRNTPEDSESLQVDNMLGALMKHTTECASPAIPYYNNFEDLFKNCYENDNCNNLPSSACKYLNETLNPFLKDFMASEASVTAYELDFFVKDDEEQPSLLNIVKGNCTGKVSSAQRKINTGQEDLIVRIKLCQID